jgi:hypothetical protein
MGLGRGLGVGSPPPQAAATNAASPLAAPPRKCRRLQRERGSGGVDGVGATEVGLFSAAAVSSAGSAAFKLIGESSFIARNNNTEHTLSQIETSFTINALEHNAVPKHTLAFSSKPKEAIWISSISASNIA